MYINFCTYCELGVQIHSFTCEYTGVPAPFVEKMLLFPSNYLGTLVDPVKTFVTIVPLKDFHKPLTRNK